MKRSHLLSLLVLLSLFLSAVLGLDISRAARPVAVSLAPSLAGHGKSPMFIENVGQFPEAVRFQMNGDDHTVWLTEDAIWVVLTKGSSSTSLSSGVEGEALGVALRLSFPGANPHPDLEPFARLKTVVSYYIGAEPRGWHAHVPVWGGVRYEGLYPGVDLVIGGPEPAQVVSGGLPLRWRLEVRDGADLAAVRLRIEGAETMTSVASPQGKGLRLTTVLGECILPLPAINAPDAPMTGLTPRLEGNVVVNPFSPHLPLLSPLSLRANPADLLYSTFLGGSSDESGWSIVDNSGATYVVGHTESGDFPTTPGAFDPARSGDVDVFVAKLNATGSELLYATYLGGTQNDYGYGIAVDDSGAAYVTGYTDSNDFSATVGSFDTDYNGGDSDGFVVKLNVNTGTLAYGSYLGGSKGDQGKAIAVDGTGAAYVIGQTNSPNFPVTSSAYDTTPNGGDDLFVLKLNPDGDTLLYSTLLGGDALEYAASIVLDGTGAAYITGYTASSNFPTTGGAFDTTLNGPEDAFVVKLNAAGNALVYATFLGGNNADHALDIAVDGNGAAYVVGDTISSDFPTTAGAYDRSYAGGTCGGNARPCEDGFVTKLKSDGSALVYGTFLGGTKDDFIRSVVVGGSGEVSFVGLTASDDFPVTSNAFDTTHNGGNYDALVGRLNAAGSALTYATFLGGGGADRGTASALDNSGVYVLGFTSSSDFPTTSGAYDTTHNGGDDVFVAKLAMGVVPPTCREVIQNGGFETGDFLHWSTQGNPQVTDFISYEGTYSALIGGENEADDTLYQEVFVPASATSAILSYRWRIISYEPLGGVYDYLYVEVRDIYGATLASLETLDNSFAQADWQQTSIDLKGYPQLLDQPIFIVFHGTTDDVNPTSFYVDDVHLEVCEEATPSPTPTLTSTLMPTSTPEPSPTSTPTATPSGTPPSPSPTPTATPTGACTDDNYEDNDSCEAAAPITPGTYHNLQICSNDEDWFAVDLKAGDIISVTVLFSQAQGDLELMLYGPDCSLPLRYSQSTTDNEQVTYAAIADGTYNIRIYGYREAQNSYDMVVSIGHRVYMPLSLKKL